MDQFVQLLTEIANYEKFLTVDELTVGTSSRGGRPSPNRSRGGVVPTNSNITPRITVSGYILPTVDTGEGTAQDTNL
jgi:hypothetical protein